MCHSTGASTSPYAATFTFITSPGPRTTLPASAGTGSTHKCRCNLRPCRNAPLTSPFAQKNTSGLRNDDVAVSCILSLWRKLLVDFRIQDQDAQKKITIRALGDLFSFASRRYSSTQSFSQDALSRWLFMWLQLRKYVTHDAVIDLFLLGGIKQLPLFQCHSSFAKPPCDHSWLRRSLRKHTGLCEGIQSLCKIS